MATAILDTNSVNHTAVELTLTTETLITLYVAAKTGTSVNHCTILQVCPDEGATWLDIAPPLTGVGLLTHKVAAAKVRVKVLKAEGAASTVDVHIIAR